MSKVNKIESHNTFKKNNLSNWEKVSDFWLNGNLSQKKDLSDFYRNKIDSFFSSHELSILDVGCGDGWILDVIESLDKSNYNYTGIDYNTVFIDFLKANKTNNKARFKYIDIEDTSITEKLDKYDVIINSFSLFEMPHYENALINQSKLLNNNGSILIFSIDPITQIMAISESVEEFKINCKYYSKYKNKGYYRKYIDTGEGFARQEYLGILHNISDYLKILKGQGFYIADLDEVNILDNIVPKIYQYAEFRKFN